ncbi:hypothetical protein STCU_00971 [Strigomonas culicis]|uniref:Uncharacterized protein n=1 Tax=Strigomonas culicis TaxID=28005 RepID=S9V476_9TRYP|nr:hypothetical protein STCU_00971 [Strigomonas culicis]|eukprot:EPY35703.1 hypothetical protein STCU_00971 [Strigomonas culicis]
MCDISYVDFVCFLLLFFGFVFNFVTGLFAFIFYLNLIFLILYYIISLFFGFIFIAYGAQNFLLYFSF